MSKLRDAAIRVLELRDRPGSIGDQVEAYSALAEAVAAGERSAAKKPAAKKPASKPKK